MGEQGFRSGAVASFAVLTVIFAKWREGLNQARWQGGRAEDIRWRLPVTWICVLCVLCGYTGLLQLALGFRLQFPLQRMLPK